MDFETTGFEIIQKLIDPLTTQILIAEFNRLPIKPGEAGLRRVEQSVPIVAPLANSTELLTVARKYLPAEPQLVRAIYFDKSPLNNWFVTWHQDKTVSVSHRFQAHGWGPWSVKAGTWHVQPPIVVLENMVTVRIHLDSATKNNGCLKVLPGSHRLGLMPPDKMRDYINNNDPFYCETCAGGAVIMRPHLLHASEKAAEPVQRRILHLEYSCYPLPYDVKWSS